MPYTPYTPYTVPIGTDLIGIHKNIDDAIQSRRQLEIRFNLQSQYYDGRHPIFNVVKTNGFKNQHLMINHAKFIVDVNAGYLLGNPVEYLARDSQDLSPMLDVYKHQTITDLDHELAVMNGIYGMAYEYIFVADNEINSVKLDPKNAMVIYDDTLKHNKLFGIIFPSTQKKGDAYTGDIIVIDTQNVYTFDKNLTQTLVTPHTFGIVPLIEYRNTSKYTNDFDSVRSLIDAYNILQSDRLNDKMQLVEAILVTYGFAMEPDAQASLRDSRIISALDKDNRVEFLTKNLDEGQADILRAKIEADIHKISMTPNLSDENFIGNASGVAIRYKLLMFEQSISNKERYFEKGLLERFQIYNAYLNATSQIPIIPLSDIDTVFKRNLPQNDLETSQIITALETIVDKATLISQLSFIDDAQTVIDKQKEEAQQAFKDNQDMFGTTQPNGGINNQDQNTPNNQNPKSNQVQNQPIGKQGNFAKL